MALSSSLKELGSGMAAVYRRYAEWLVSITWKRFIVLSILLLIVTGILSNLPPFNWDIATRSSRVPASRSVDITIDDSGVKIKPKKKNSTAPEITIDENGVRIKRKGDAAEGRPEQEVIVDEKGVRLRRNGAPAAPTPPAPATAPKPQSSFSEDLHREVIEPFKREIHAEMERHAAEDAAEARRDLDEDMKPQELAAEIRRDVMDSLSDLSNEERVVHTRLGEFLPQLAFLFIMLSAAIKIAYARTVKAEAKAAEASHVAEEESLKRQVVEARMAAMQAQVEPHFLFNTLASIDHLIETDPARASQMQKNLIALLRASMPAMREKSTNLGRELDVVRPYLEILKVSMGDRLQSQV